MGLLYIFKRLMYGGCLAYTKWALPQWTLPVECILVLEEVTLWFAVKLVLYPPPSQYQPLELGWLGSVILISLHACLLSQNRVVTR